MNTEIKPISIRKDVYIWNSGEPFTVHYVKTVKNKSDADTCLYDTYKIAFLLTDGLVAVMNDHVLGAQMGSILFFRPNEIHFGRFLRSGVHEYLCFYVPLSFFDHLSTKDDLLSFLEDRSEDHINFILPDESNPQELLKPARKIVELLLSHDSPDPSTLFSLMLQSFLLCHDRYPLQKRKGSPETVPPYVSRTLSFIAEHFHEKISLESIAAELGCSVTYLSRIFKRHIGVTVYKHITDVRIGNAAAMLKGGSSVTEACFDSGFNDCSNFIRIFRKTIGVTPLEYKKTP